MSAGATTTLFFTPQYLRENTVIGDSVDGTIIQPVVRLVQDKYIHPILSSSLYTELQDQINNNTLSGDYLTLMTQYVVPCMSQYCIYELVPYLNYKFRAKGISRQTSDTSTPADLSELYYIRDNIRDTAQFYGDMLTKYLCANHNLFPEYNVVNTADDLTGNSSDYFGGIHIPEL
jgi:hypothetical protein